MDDVRVHIEFPSHKRCHIDDVHFRKKNFFLSFSQRSYLIFNDMRESEVSAAINNKAMKIYEIAVFCLLLQPRLGEGTLGKLCISISPINGMCHENKCKFH